MNKTTSVKIPKDIDTQISLRNLKVMEEIDTLG